MKRAIGIVASAAILCAWPAPASAELTNSHQIWTTFTADELVGVAQELGSTASATNGPDGPEVDITTSKGFQYSANPVACQSDGNCYGLIIQAAFANANPAVDANWLSDFNLKHVFTTAMLSGGEIILVRYEICDFGVAKGNVASDLTNFERSARHLLDGLGRSGWQ